MNKEIYQMRKDINNLMKFLGMLYSFLVLPLCRWLASSQI